MAGSRDPPAGAQRCLGRLASARAAPVAALALVDCIAEHRQHGRWTRGRSLSTSRNASATSGKKDSGLIKARCFFPYTTGGPRAAGFQKSALLSRYPWGTHAPVWRQQYGAPRGDVEQRCSTLASVGSQNIAPHSRPVSHFQDFAHPKPMPKPQNCRRAAPYGRGGLTARYPRSDPTYETRQGSAATQQGKR